VLCRVLLYAVNLRHGTDGFTSPRKEVRSKIERTFNSVEENSVTLVKFNHGFDCLEDREKQTV
jgi:hypothetical protein